MVKFGTNLIFSLSFHAAVIVSLLVSFRGTENRVPENVMAVSLEEETAYRKYTASFTQNTRQKMKDGTTKRITSREHLPGENRGAFSRDNDNNERESTSCSEKESMTVIVGRDAVLSAIHSRQDTSLLYENADREENNSGNALPDNIYSLIRDAIAKAKTYPLIARKRKIEGTVVMGFSIDDHGYPGDLTIRKSSGHEILDSAALRIVSKAAPLPKVTGQIIVPITFKLTEPSSPQ